MKFIIEINLNKTTMRTGHNVAAALIDVARKLLTREKFTNGTKNEGEVLDSKGSPIGTWKVAP